MIETIAKITGVFKMQALPLFLMTMFRTDTEFFSERKELIHDEDTPGDNFPYIAMKGHNLLTLGIDSFPLLREEAQNGNIIYFVQQGIKECKSYGQVR